MSKLRTFRRNLDDDAVDRAGKTTTKPAYKGPRVGHRWARKSAKKMAIVAVAIPPSKTFYENLAAKRQKNAKKAPRVKYLQRLRDVDFRHKMTRYQKRHSAEVW